ncbi:MAG TPA: 1,2-phenylacetyl-CoA epoxidase subunit PaaD [Steroidobacteraceae bacterium]
MSAPNDSVLERAAAERRVWDVLQAVTDPEIPVLSIVDLGIVRYARLGPEGRVRVGISPTYSGCPATAVIKQSVGQALQRAGFANIELEDVIAPAWTSDWITDAGRSKLLEYGIAPPAESVSSVRQIVRPSLVIKCPRCGSAATSRVSEFGSTPCKALYRCTSCLEPFDYFKCH